MSLRVDKFVWFVRLAKTRSQSAEQITKGKVKLNLESVKPSKEVKIGDRISIHKNTAVFSYKILQLLDRRVGAKLVQDYIIDITPEEEVEKYKAYQLSQSIYRDNGSGKPTKKDRRNIDEFLEGW